MGTIKRKPGMADLKDSLEKGPPTGVRYMRMSAYNNIHVSNKKVVRSRNGYVPPVQQPAPPAKKAPAKKTPVQKRRERSRGQKKKASVGNQRKETVSTQVSQSVAAAEQASNGMSTSKGKGKGKRADSLVTTPIDILDEAERKIGSKEQETDEDKDEDNAPATRRGTRARVAAEENQVWRRRVDLDERVDDLVGCTAHKCGVERAAHRFFAALRTDRLADDRRAQWTVWEITLDPPIRMNDELRPDLDRYRLRHPYDGCRSDQTLLRQVLT